MDVLMACPEVAPIFKGSVLADSVAALSKSLSHLEHKVTVALPRLPAVEEAGLMLARRLTPLRIDVRGEILEATLFDARLGSGVELVVVDLPGVVEASGSAAEGARLWGLFSRAVAELATHRSRSGGSFDVVHAHDWHGALACYLLRDSAVRTVLTVHDATRQGRFDKGVIDDIGLSWDDFHPDGVELYGQVSYLKAGVLRADVVTTVSPGHAAELRQPALGGGLEGVYRARGDAFVGILHGIDYAQWSPSTDPHLAARYDAEDVVNKGRCKASVLRELDLPLEPERPLLLALGPVTKDKGSDVLARALGDIVKNDARVVIAGDGDATLAKLLEDATASLPGDALYLGPVSEPTTHRLLAAADALLLPSRVEPGGEWSMRAQRYGAAPIVHAVGGSIDSVVDCDAQLETGTGFVFDELTPSELAQAVARAVAAMRTPRWGVLRRRLMRLDRSWERPARRYARLYQG
jgi:starch synthase